MKRTKIWSGFIINRTSVHLLFLLLLVSGIAVRSEELPEASLKELPRFHKVNEGLYRGGQPKASGFEILQAMHIKTVINFRNDNDEREDVERLGMEHVHIPLSAWNGIQILSVREFFKILNDPDNYPIFVHCKRGADRTGAMIAFYRIAFQQWTPEQAYEEARDIGLRWWYSRLKNQIRNFDLKYYMDIIHKESGEPYYNQLR
jgi:tyrosine-protein phosphatase SIW14